MKELIKAVDLGEVEQLKDLCRSIQNVNDVVDEKKQNLLMRAAEKIDVLNKDAQHELSEKRAKIAAYLIERGIRVNELTNGKSAAHLAAFHGHVGIIRTLLKAGADFNLKTDYPLHLTPLEIALHDERDIMLFSEHSQIALEILKAGVQKDLNNGANFFGLPPLLMAIRKGDFAVISYLLENREKNGLDVKGVSSELANASLFCVSKALEFRPKDKTDQSPCYQAYLSLFKALTEAGVDYSQTDRDGDSALSYIEGYRMADFMRVLKQKVGTPFVLQSLVRLREINNIRY